MTMRCLNTGEAGREVLREGGPWRKSWIKKGPSPSWPRGARGQGWRSPLGMEVSKMGMEAKRAGILDMGNHVGILPKDIKKVRVRKDVNNKRRIS